MADGPDKRVGGGAERGRHRARTSQPREVEERASISSTRAPIPSWPSRRYRRRQRLDSASLLDNIDANRKVQCFNTFGDGWGIS